jgi:glyoxylase-like metal-dependent hydrolase (beta-lactamase superfamily II)
MAMSQPADHHPALPASSSGAPPPEVVWPEHLQPGRAVTVAPGVDRIIAPNPSFMTGPGTNTYLLGDDRLALIDPGPADDAHFVTLLEAVGDRLGWILVTHTHIDHAPLAGRLKAATGAEILAFGPAPDQPPWMNVGGLDAHDRDFAPDRILLDGDRLDTGELAIEAVYTPGHASNHLCFELTGSGLLFSGDHIMSGSTVVVGPPDGDMAKYLESLERVKARAPRRIAPGHGDVIEDPAAVLDEYLRHRRAREAQVLAGLAVAPEAGVTVEQLVEAIYTDVPAHLHPVARYSVWGHLRKLAADGRARSAEIDDLEALWLPALSHPAKPAAVEQG